MSRGKAQELACVTAPLEGMRYVCSALAARDAFLGFIARRGSERGRHLVYVDALRLARDMLAAKAAGAGGKEAVSSAPTRGLSPPWWCVYLVKVYFPHMLQWVQGVQAYNVTRCRPCRFLRNMARARRRGAGSGVALDV